MAKKNSLKALSKNKGFTLVELIVVLVILAILAAILVPTLLGYIDRARSEKDFATAQAIRVAAQAEADEIYGKNIQSAMTQDSTTKKWSVNKNGLLGYKDKIFELVGATVTKNGDKVTATLDGQAIDITDVTIKDNQITAIIVQVGSTTKFYKYTTDTNTWESTDSDKLTTNP